VGSKRSSLFRHLLSLSVVPRNRVPALQDVLQIAILDVLEHHFVEGPPVVVLLVLRGGD